MSLQKLNSRSKKESRCQESSIESQIWLKDWWGGGGGASWRRRRRLLLLKKDKRTERQEGILVCIGRYLRDMCSCLSLDVDEVTRRLLLRQVGCICLAFRICWQVRMIITTTTPRLLLLLEVLRFLAPRGNSALCVFLIYRRLSCSPIGCGAVLRSLLSKSSSCLAWQKPKFLTDSSCPDSLSLSTFLFLLLAIASKRAQYSGSPRTVWPLRPDVIERETKKATSAREYPKHLLLPL